MSRSKCSKCDGSGLLHVRYWGRGDIACTCAAGRAVRVEYADLYARWERQNERDGKDERVGVGQ